MAPNKALCNEPLLGNRQDPLGRPSCGADLTGV